MLALKIGGVLVRIGEMTRAGLWYAQSAEMARKEVEGRLGCLRLMAAVEEAATKNMRACKALAEGKSLVA